jgi:hypothetical protein
MELYFSKFSIKDEANSIMENKQRIISIREFIAILIVLKNFNDKN